MARLSVLLLGLLFLLPIQPPHPKSVPAIQVSYSTVSGLQDADSLTQAASEFGVPPVIVWAIARVESGVRGRNTARGAGVVVPKRDVHGDSIGTKVICQAIGRMQILPCYVDSNKKIHWLSWTKLTPHCAIKSLYEYSSNIRCGAAILAYQRRQVGSWSLAIRRYNGAGPQAELYGYSAEAIIGQITLRILEDTTKTP